MTLHLTQVSNLYTLQVGDRKVSGRINDPLANKNIIYWARDAIVTLGYAGLAYDLEPSDRSVPTDEWIASKLLGGGIIPRGRDGVRPAMFGNVSNGRWLDIAESLQTLKAELEKSIVRLPQALTKYAFELTIAGWQFPTRKSIRPFVAELSKSPQDLSIRMDFPMRRRRFGSYFGVWATPGGYLTPTEENDLRSFLRSGDLSPADRANVAEQKFVDTIRCVASRERGVGSHCMSILLPPPTSSAIRVRFNPSVEHRAVFRGNNWQQELPVAYTPWVIGNGGFQSPSVIAGGETSYVMGPFTVVFEGPQTGGRFMFMGAQSRAASR